MKKFIGLICMLVTALYPGFVTGAKCAELQPEMASDSLPLYVHIVLDDAPVATMLPDSVFNLIAGTTIFRVNSSELTPSDPLLADIAARLRPLTESGLYELASIELRGSSSPEGPYHNNDRLSRDRTAAMQRFLSNNLDAQYLSTIVTRAIAEDYNYLVWLMEQRNDPAAKVVRKFVEECGLENHATIKRRIQLYDSGRLWRRLLRSYFPELRAARVVIHFRRKAPIADIEADARDMDTDVTTPAEPPTPIVPVVPVVPEPLEQEPVIPPALTTPSLLGETATDIIEEATRNEIERRHVLSVSSNLLYDAFYMPQFGWAPMPNIALEYYPARGKFTFRAAFMFPYWHRWNKHKFFQIRDYHLEVRRYFKPGELHTGWYLGAYLHGTKYGIGLGKKKGWQGEGGGLAVKGGYVLPLGSGRWRLDFHVAVGAFLTLFDPYVYGNPVTGQEDGDYYYDYTGSAEGFHRRNHRLFWFGPSEVGVTITYDLLYKRINKRGVSFRRKEVVE